MSKKIYLPSGVSVVSPEKEEKPKEEESSDEKFKNINKCTHHVWKKYIGFNEIYFYCLKCDAKKDADK